MTDQQTVTIEPKVFEYDKFSLRLLTMLKAKYILWREPRYGPEGFRWALRSWQDDGVGLKTHGAAFSLQGAARAVYENHCQREELTASETRHD